MSTVGRQTVLVVGTNYSPEVSGIGPYTTLMAESVATEFDVDVVAGVPHYPQWIVDRRYRYRPVTKELVGGVPVTRLRHHVPRRPNLRGRLLMEGSFTAVAPGPIVAKGADAIIAVTPSLAALAAATIGRRRRPLGVVVQDLTGAAAAQTGAAGAGVSGIIGGSEMAMLRRATLVGVVAADFIEPLVTAGVSADRIIEIPNPARVEVSDLSAPQARAQLGWDTHRPLAVHTGNMGLKQGLETIIDAAAESPEIDFVLVGDGGCRSDLEGRVSRLELQNLRFVDPVTEADYPTVLAAADVLLLSEAPTVASMSLPSKISSYIVAGRPIVAAVRSDGITGEYLRRHRVAHVVPPNGRSLAREIHDVLADTTRCSEQHAAQKALAESLSVERARLRYVGFARRLFSNETAGLEGHSLESPLGLAAKHPSN